MKRSIVWQDIAQWLCRIGLAWAASGAGVVFIERLQLGFAGQSIFWPPYAVALYWLVLRDINFPRKPAPAATTASVRIRFRLAAPGFGTHAERDGVHQLTDRLQQALLHAGTGTVDGDEFGGGECTLFLYGPDPQAVFDSVQPILRGSEFLQGAEVVFCAAGSRVPSRAFTL